MFGVIIWPISAGGIEGESFIQAYQQVSQFAFAEVSIKQTAQFFFHVISIPEGPIRVYAVCGLECLVMGVTGFNKEAGNLFA